MWMLELRQGLQNTSQSERGDWLRLKQSQEQTRREKKAQGGQKGSAKRVRSLFVFFTKPEALRRIKES